jgi:hypothetical protein
MKLDINVSHENTVNGVTGDCRLCPVALAFRQHPEVVYADVFETYAEVRLIDEDCPAMVTIPLPHDVTRRIVQYDDHGTMDPFVFRVVVPE